MTRLFSAQRLCAAQCLFLGLAIPVPSVAAATAETPLALQAGEVRVLGIPGVARVAVAWSQDPSPKASGRGLDRLRAAGVTVETGLMETEAAELYADYIRALASGRDSR